MRQLLPAAAVTAGVVRGGTITVATVSAGAMMFEATVAALRESGMWLGGSSGADRSRHLADLVGAGEFAPGQGGDHDGPGRSSTAQWARICSKPSARPGRRVRSSIAAWPTVSGTPLFTKVLPKRATHDPSVQRPS
jgi:hypothetical protein